MSIGKSLKRFLLDYNVIVILLGVVIYAYFFVPYFNYPKNLTNVLVDSSVFGIVCIGMSFCLLTGGVDLSMGFQAALSACLVCYFASHVNLAVGIVVAVAACMLVGFLNGVLISRLKLGSLISTLAMMRILYGLILVITNENEIINSNTALVSIYGTKVFGIRLPILIFVVCCIVAEFILRKTKLGTSIYIVGGNAEAGKVVGLNMERARILAFVLGGFFAGVGGVVLASRYGMGSTMIGDGLNLVIVSACIVGGISISGGKGNMVRAFLGIIVMRTIINVMVLKLINGYDQSLIQGVVIVLVLIVDKATSLKKKTTHG